MSKLTGQDAIDYAARTGAQLNKYADPVEGAREGLTVAEAEDVAAEDPGLVWCEQELIPNRVGTDANGADLYTHDSEDALIERGIAYWADAEGLHAAD